LFVALIWNSYSNTPDEASVSVNVKPDASVTDVEPLTALIVTDESEMVSSPVGD